MLTTRHVANFLFFCLTVFVVSIFSNQSIAGERGHRSGGYKHRSYGQPTSYTARQKSSYRSVRGSHRGLRVVAGGGRGLRVLGGNRWVYTRPIVRRPIEIDPLNPASRIISVSAKEKALGARRAVMRRAKYGRAQSSSRGFVVLTKTPTIQREVNTWYEDEGGLKARHYRTIRELGHEAYDAQDEDELPVVYFDD